MAHYTHSLHGLTQPTENWFDYIAPNPRYKDHEHLSAHRYRSCVLRLHYLYHLVKKWDPKENLVIDLATFWYQLFWICEHFNLGILVNWQHTFGSARTVGTSGIFIPVYWPTGQGILMLVNGSDQLNTAIPAVMLTPELDVLRESERLQQPVKAKYTLLNVIWSIANSWQPLRKPGKELTTRVRTFIKELERAERIRKLTGAGYLYDPSDYVIKWTSSDTTYY